MPERGKDLGGFPRLTALKVEEVTPDSHVYMSCKKMVMKAMDLGHGLFCKYSKTGHLTQRSMGQINCGV